MNNTNKIETYQRLMLDAAVFIPERLSSPPSWIGHIPFINFLIRYAQPKKIVELGTHTGNSYLAICQTIACHQLESKCFAIDTWEGDEHASHYDETVYSELSAYHRPRYESFSTLLRMRFEDAVEQFSDRSIDLLHIDGLHTYEAVKQDFTTWRPKLAPGAFVLFHDTAVKERGFGVSRFWNELKQEYADMFEFDHSSGLGVLRMPSDHQTDLPWVSSSQYSSISFRHYFETIGNNLLDSFNNQTLCESISAFNSHLGTQPDLKANLPDILRPLNDLISSIKFESICKFKELHNEFLNTENSLAAIKNSTSWKITKPFRVAIVQIRLIKTEGLKNRLRAIIALFVNISKKIIRRLFPKTFIKIKSLIIQHGSKFKIRQFYFRLSAHHLKNSDESPFSNYNINVHYPKWSEAYDTPSAEFMSFISERAYHDKLTLLIASFDHENIDNLPEFISSIQQCPGRHWNLLFTFSANISHVANNIAKSICHSDPRFIYDYQQLNQTPEYLIFIDGSAIPRPHSIYLFTYYLELNPESIFAYSDEDQLIGGIPQNPWFKPNFSPSLADQGALLGDMIAIRPSAINVESWLRLIADSRSTAQQLITDFALTIDRSKILHLPYVLYHGSENRSNPKMLCTDFISHPIVSIIIPTRDRWDLLEPCLASIEKSSWPTDRYEVLIVDNGSIEDVTLKNLDRLSRENVVRVLRSNEPFNWSALNNLGAENALGSVFIFLNNDIEILDPYWISKLVTYATMQDVGAVGCKLLYPDLTVQHGGVIGGINGTAGHGHLFLDQTAPGYQNLSTLTRESIAITGACLAVTKDHFHDVGGFNTNFRVAFNDVAFCFDQYLQGRRNIYIGEPLMIHHESKSRGYDDTPEKIARNHAESLLAWELYADVLRQDPYYSPNLSLKSPYQLSFVPRRPKIETHYTCRKQRIMMLSATHAVGHGVAVVIELQTAALIKAGYDVIIAGPISPNDIAYPDCERIEVCNPESAAVAAFRLGIDLVIAHTPPFYSVARWLGNSPKVIAYDYGEPPCDWFPDSDNRFIQHTEKSLVIRMSHAAYAISDAIFEEAQWPLAGVIPLGNAHLGQWNDSYSQLRDDIRLKHQWQDKTVVLNVCRFHAGERQYKGVDVSTLVRSCVHNLDPVLASQIIFVHCGKGDPKDVKVLRDAGFQVFSNVTDREMFELYVAADLYANFSQWEGYNLGIGQALAMGLPTIASDIPAHRAFGIKTTNSPECAAEWIADFARTKGHPERIPKVWTWDRPLKQLIEIVSKTIQP